MVEEQAKKPVTSKQGSVFVFMLAALLLAWFKPLH
jgi:hypothetical protein